jgi:hypothetical protein
MKSLMLKKETQECFSLGFDDLMRVDVLLELRVQLPMAVAPWNDCCLCWVFSPLSSVHLK